MRMKLFRVSLLSTALAGFMPVTVWAEGSGSAVFELGEIEVNAQGEAQSDPPFVMRVDKEHMEQFQALNISDALRNEPGITLTSGGRRAESQLYIRGFDARQITLNVDGIPVYVPYDGNVDLSRFLTADFEQVVVTKGLGSLMYGPNSMGGTINLVTKRPDKDFSGSVNLDLITTAEDLYTYAGSMQLGGWMSKQFYATGGLAGVSTDGFPLSDDFVGNAVQPSGSRVNADSNDVTANLKVGYVPNAKDEYTLSYMRIDSDKSAPPYAGSQPNNLVYWDWPQWDKQSVYYIGHTSVGDGFVKTRVYYDSFDNKLTAYDDASMTTTKKNSSFKSAYEDASWGAIIEGGLPIGEHMLKSLLSYKNDEHNETDLAKDGKKYDSPWLAYSSHTWSGGLEDVWALSKATDLTLGYRYDNYSVDQVQEYADSAKTQVKDTDTGGDDSSNNILLTLGHTIEGHRIYAGAALKSRFPTLKDRYSYRLGKAIPNPSLSQEDVVNLEVGARGKLGVFGYQVSIYHAQLEDAIESVTVKPGVTQLQNVGSATNQGVDLSFDVPLGDEVLFSTSYSYLDRSLSNAALVPTNTPKNQLLSTLAWMPNAKAELDVDFEYAGSRQTSTDGLRPVSSYNLFNLRSSYAVNKDLTLRAGIYNLLDKNYEITEGDPMPGRTLHLTMSYRF